MVVKERSFGFSLIATTLILLSSEIIVSTLFPLVGFHFFRISIGVLIILFLSFYKNGTFIALLIIYFQYIHGLFTIESWAIGAVAGVGISIIISYLRDWIHLSNKLVTIIFVQFFQLAWFILASAIIYFKSPDIGIVMQKFWLFLPESVVLSVISPYFFRLLNIVWACGEQQEIQGAN